MTPALIPEMVSAITLQTNDWGSKVKTEGRCFGANLFVVEYPERGVALIISSPTADGQRDDSAEFVTAWDEIAKEYRDAGYVAASMEADTTMELPLCPQVYGPFDIYVMYKAYDHYSMFAS